MVEMRNYFRLIGEGPVDSWARRVVRDLKVLEMSAVRMVSRSARKSVRNLFLSAFTGLLTVLFCLLLVLLAFWDFSYCYVLFSVILIGVLGLLQEFSSLFLLIISHSGVIQ